MMEAAAACSQGQPPKEGSMIHALMAPPLAPQHFLREAYSHVLELIERIILSQLLCLGSQSMNCAG